MNDLIDLALTKFAETVVAECARCGVSADHPTLVEALYAALPLAEDRFRHLDDEQLQEYLATRH